MNTMHRLMISLMIGLSFIQYSFTQEESAPSIETPPTAQNDSVDILNNDQQEGSEEKSEPSLPLNSDMPSDQNAQEVPNQEPSQESNPTVPEQQVAENNQDSLSEEKVTSDQTSSAQDNNTTIDDQNDQESVQAAPAPQEEPQTEEPVEVVPTQTAPLEEEPAEEQPAPIVQAPGIDTLEQDGGNWLLKRVSLEKTVDLIEKINNLFTQILESRMDFLVKRNTTDRAFDAFARDIDFELGDLDNLLKRLIEVTQTEKNVHGDLSEEERELQETADKKDQDLNNLRTTVQDINDLDASLDDVIMQIEQEVNKSNNYQLQAWNNFQSIKQILSDEKAEELYLSTEGLYRNMQDIQTYLKNDLTQYFDKVVKNITDSMDKAKTTMASLQTGGTDLKQEAQAIKDKEVSDNAEKMNVKTDADLKVVQAVQQPKSWFDTLAIVWRWPLQKISVWWQMLTGLFSSSGDVVTLKTSPNVDVATPVVPTQATPSASTSPAESSVPEETTTSEESESTIAD